MTHFPEALLDGYLAFKEHKYAHEATRYRQLAEDGQTPDTLVIACCDSRAAPEIIFNAIPGQIFVVRNVANLVPPYKPDGEFHSTSAALEFAVQALRVKDIVVLGHGRCGGIQAALDPAAEPLSPGDFIGRWMELLGPAAEAVSTNQWMTDTERQIALERISIRHSISNLLTFPCIEILHGRGKLHLHGAWFDISQGELWTMDAETGDFSCVV
ncbi:MAG: carbonic anhydrase [Hyphomicrobiales bacterium]|nr:carbonic anhydrase [Hyphomicrobiales bacterium]